MHRINTRNLGLFIYQFFCCPIHAFILLSLPLFHSYRILISFASFLFFSLYSLFHQNIRLWCVSVCAFFFCLLLVKRETIKQFRASIRLSFVLHIYTTMTTINTGNFFFCYFSRYSTEIQAFVLNSNEIYIFCDFYILCCYTCSTHFLFCFRFLQHNCGLLGVFILLCVQDLVVCVFYLYIIPPLFLTYLPALVYVCTVKILYMHKFPLDILKSVVKAFLSVCSSTRSFSLNR